jgi:hypothetical protein
MPGDGACATSTGDCTLRAAIDEAAALAVPPASVTIAVPAGHYAITLGDLAPGCAGCMLAIEGAGASTTIVEGSPGGAMVAAASPLSLQGLALSHVGAHGGIVRLDVQATGKRGAEISLGGAGHALGLGTPLPVVPLRVQLQAAAGCWEAEYPEAKANDGTTVRATVK